MFHGEPPSGGPRTYEGAGVLSGSGHFDDHKDTSYKVMYLGGNGLPSPTVLVVQHAGADSDQWLLHEVEDIYRWGDYDEDRILRIYHCVRAHRNKDVKPETKEAKLVAGCDSLTHLVFAPYMDMVRVGLETGVRSDALGKLERDYRDVKKFLPELQDTFRAHYHAWKAFIKNAEWHLTHT